MQAVHEGVARRVAQGRAPRAAQPVGDLVGLPSE